MQKTPSKTIQRTLAMLLASATIMPVAIEAADYSANGAATREIARRKQAVVEADRLFQEGREAYAKEDFQSAHDKLRTAISVLPNAPVLADRRSAITSDYAKAAVALAGQYRKTGKRDEARALLEAVTAPGVDPENGLAKIELEYLDDPIRTNPALTHQHTQNIDQVRRALYMGEGYYNLADFDNAKKQFEKVLTIDKYNSAARRWLERVNQAKRDYYKTAYDHSRSELLMQVDEAWATAVPMEAPLFAENVGPTNPTKAGSQLIITKLKTIVLPSVQLEDETVEGAIEFIRQRCRELDTLSQNVNEKGINFVILRPGGGNSSAPAPVGGLEGGQDTLATPTVDSSTIRIKELRLTNVPVAEALRQICEQARLKYKVGEYAVSIVPASQSTEDIVYRVFTVPPDFLTAVGGASEGGGEAPEADPFNPTPGSGGTQLKRKPTAQEALVSRGVPFPDKSSASYNAANSTLIVRNTPSNMELIEEIVNSLRIDSPKQIKIMTKFVEISQENTEELGFDWIVTPFGIGSGLFPGGGTVGNGAPRSNGDFLNPVNGVNIPSIPAAPGTNVSDIVTAGNRSGSLGITRDSIDAILNNPTRTAQNASVAPGILSFTGLFNNGQFQMVMRGLSQKKGADIMTAPSIMARSGQKAKIEIIREFIYPTEYEPPQLPQNVGGGGGFGGIGGNTGGNNSFPVTPATPTAFETRNTGVTMEIEPILSANNSVIDLTFAPEIVEFEGFINYGSPIQSPSSDALGNPTTVTITENRIEMPVFSVRRVNTSLQIYDGHTVAVGGLMREDVQNVEDKVPILGDLPLIGRLFQTKAENRIKSNLIIFVTANVIDATGAILKDSNAVTPLADLPTVATDLIPPVGVLPQ